MMAHVIYTAARVLYANAEPVTVCLLGITGGLRVKITKKKIRTPGRLSESDWLMQKYGSRDES